MKHGRYLVTGHREYRGHPPGSVFEARLDPQAEARAITRGAIRLIERVEPSLDGLTFRLPQDWPPHGGPIHAQTEAPQGASVVSKEEK